MTLALVERISSTSCSGLEHPVDAAGDACCDRAQHGDVELRQRRQHEQHDIVGPHAERMKQVGGLARLRSQFAIAEATPARCPDCHRRCKRIAILSGSSAQPCGNPVVQIPGEHALVERHALQLLDIVQRSQRRVAHLHWRSIPECHLGHYVRPTQAARPRITVARRKSACQPGTRRLAASNADRTKGDRPPYNREFLRARRVAARGLSRFGAVSQLCWSA